MQEVTRINGHIIDIRNRNIIKGEITILGGKIHSIIEKEDVNEQYILPGFVDAHIHIESSMVTPYAFAQVALGHGTVATVSDPHEIANVCGMEGVRYMIENAKNAGLQFYFGAPSCVPATTFENAGAIINADDVKTLLEDDDIWYLSEMMNYPGVLYKNQEVLAKINHAKAIGKPIDGHAPGLRGDDAKNYISAGISTDHECYTIEEAKEKLKYGMKIIIREGSAAKNYAALHTLIESNSDDVMFCSDDKHPDDLIVGHINVLVKRSIALGYDLFDVLKIACINPVNHYGLPVGMLAIGDSADFIIVKDIQDWDVKQTIIKGRSYFNDGHCTLPDISTSVINHFEAEEIDVLSLQIQSLFRSVPVIEAIDGSLITEKTIASLPSDGTNLLSDPNQDVLKICVINRYKKAPPAVGFIKNFNLKDCAIASTVAHDSHNIIAVGTDDDLISRAVNLLVASKGGLAAVTPDEHMHLALPIAGLMSDRSVVETGQKYKSISDFVKSRGCTLSAPFMTLSFMALLVIPKIKISDLGMFDAETFTFYD
ncbi:MAG: adenine deaminase [Saprospiraceae bacterium]